MSEEKTEKTPIASKEKRDAAVSPVETEKTLETIEGVKTEQQAEADKGVEIVKEQGREDMEVLKVYGANPEEREEFREGEKKIEDDAGKAREEYDNSSKIIINNNNMENREQSKPGLTREEIMSKLEKINKKIDDGYKTGMSMEENANLKEQRAELLGLLGTENIIKRKEEENSMVNGEKYGEITLKEAEMLLEDIRKDAMEAKTSDLWLLEKKDILDALVNKLKGTLDGEKGKIFIKTGKWRETENLLREIKTEIEKNPETRKEILEKIREINKRMERVINERGLADNEKTEKLTRLEEEKTKWVLLYNELDKEDRERENNQQ